ncbi:MAG: tetraacyldisaccharide 4'-kinase [Phycisphaerae bacterium]|nr:tetraacyldisaccharide 4'-kinase [Phycisphaerae bacterium]
MNQNSYRNLISVRGGRVDKRLLRSALRLVSLPYGSAVAVRNLGYNTGLLKSHAADVPVISVGNITTGGTGKTPLVVWLCRRLHEKGLRCAVLTRGYKSTNGGVDDEPAILKKACPEAKVIVNPDRVAGAARAVSEFGADVLVMDDGFQHRRLRRDLDILAVDATRPFGYGRLLPAGLLREPVGAIERADAVVITRYDQIAPFHIDRLEKEILRIKPKMVVAKAIHQHPCARGTGGAVYSLEDLKQQRLFVFCGIGNPEAFLKRLREHGLCIAGKQVYNDHHHYTESDFGQIQQAAKAVDATMILATEKDWVKTALATQKYNELPLVYLVVELEFVAGVDKMDALIDGVLNRP